MFLSMRLGRLGLSPTKFFLVVRLKLNSGRQSNYDGGADAVVPAECCLGALQEDAKLSEECLEQFLLFLCVCLV